MSRQDACGRQGSSARAVPGREGGPTPRPHAGSRPPLLHEPSPAHQTPSSSGSRGGGRPRTLLRPARPARPRMPTCGREAPRQGTGQLAGADEAHAHGGRNLPGSRRRTHNAGLRQVPGSRTPRKPDPGSCRQLPARLPGPLPTACLARWCRGASGGPRPTPPGRPIRGREPGRTNLWSRALERRHQS